MPPGKRPARGQTQQTNLCCRVLTKPGNRLAAYGDVLCAFFNKLTKIDVTVSSQSSSRDLDLVAGHNKANTSPILKLVLSRVDDLIARVSSNRPAAKPQRFQFVCKSSEPSICGSLRL